MTAPLSTAVGPLLAGACSDAGPRAVNEDSYLADTQRGWFLVADGVGGPGKGDRASGVVKEAVAAAMVAAGPAVDQAQGALVSANRAIVRAVLEQSDLKGMGSTATVLVVNGPRADVWHVGDTRVIQIRGQGSRVITEDHTLAAQLVRLNRLAADQVAQHPARNTLLRCLGKESSPKLDHVAVDVAPGDRFVLCSDGLHAWVPTPRIAEVVAGAVDGESAARQLVEEALRAGGTDNVTVVVVTVPATGVAPPAPALAPMPAAAAAATPVGPPMPPRLRTLLQALAVAPGAEAVYAALGAAAIDAVGAQRLTVVDGAERPIAAYERRGAVPAEPVGPLAGRVIGTGRPELDVDDDGAISTGVSLIGFKVGARAAVPVPGPGGVVAVLVAEFGAAALPGPEVVEPLTDVALAASAAIRLAIASVAAPQPAAEPARPTPAPAPAAPAVPEVPPAVAAFVPVRVDETLMQDDFTPRQWAVWREIDGVKALPQLAVASGLALAEAMAVVVELELAGRLYRRGGVAPPAQT